MTEEVRKERSPGIKLLLVGIVGFILMVPLLLVYALVYDRQNQSQTAQTAINSGWGGPQVVAGPVIVVPYRTTQVQTEQVNGQTVTRNVEVERYLYISPVENKVATTVNPQVRTKSIYSSVLYESQVTGTARFELPADLPRFGVTRERLEWDQAQLRMGASDARGLTKGGTLKANGQELAVQPGKGPGATGGEGFFAFVQWNGEGSLSVDYGFGLRGSRSLSLVPRGGHTVWNVTSSWTNPSFGGAFLPEKRDVPIRVSRRTTPSTSWRSDRLRSRRTTRACRASMTAVACHRSPIAMLPPPAPVRATRPQAGRWKTSRAVRRPSPSGWSSPSTSIPRSIAR